MKKFLITLTFAFTLLIPVSTFAQTTTPSASAQPTPNTGTFVPLTQFPQLDKIAQPGGFATSVNTIYRVLVGAGAVLAVIMIMIAGVEFMTNRGSVSSNEKAKNHIRNAIFGLILVLAPTIVFSIINPDILNIDLSKEFENLKPSALKQDAFTSPSGTPSSGTNSYILAYYFTRTNASTNYTCYVSGEQSYSTQDACTTAKNIVPSVVGTPPTGTTQSSVTYVKSCELGDASSVTISVPNNVPRCP